MNSKQLTLINDPADVKLLHITKINWGDLRLDIFNATGLSPSAPIAQHSVEFSEAAEYLVFVSYLLLGAVDNDPHKLLLNLPRVSMNFLQYTFLINVDISEANATLESLRGRTGAQYVVQDNCILATGPLTVWYDSIVMNLTYPNMLTFNTRLILDKIYILLGREGLSSLFTKFNKTTLDDGTFTL